MNISEIGIPTMGDSEMTDLKGAPLNLSEEPPIFEQAPESGELTSLAEIFGIEEEPKDKEEPKDEGQSKNEKLTINYKIGDKPHTQNLADLLLIGSLTTKDYTDVELDDALEKVSYWRSTFLVAFCQEMEIKKKLQNRFDLWYADACRDAERRLADSRQDAIGKGMSGWMLQCTHQQVLSEVLSSEEDRVKYTAMKREIVEREAQEELLRGIWGDLENRGMHLMAIAKRRFAERNKFEVKD